jgi:murein DD-endopeptidase MepM/ murein hydrolase activator NlpD
MDADTCLTCGQPLDEAQRFLIVRGRRHEAYCSEPCLRRRVVERWVARARARRRRTLRALLVALVAAGGATLWKRHRSQPPASISFDQLDEARPRPVAPAPILFGPAWPPTDDDWTFAFDRAAGTYPLPGPVRRAPAPDARIFVRNHPALCREEGRCGVDLGGELWGEHVYAALDGVVERVQRGGTEDGGGQYVRLSHMGGMVFTQYFHLAALPRGLARGSRVRAGDVIGLLGDTGLEGRGRHLGFTLSVQPSGDLPEVYWDPTPWMGRWRLRVPEHGTVAGFMAADGP